MVENVPQIPDAKKLHVDCSIVCAKHCEILKHQVCNRAI